MMMPPSLVRAVIRHYPGDGVSRWAARFLSPAGSTDTMAMLKAMTSAIKDEFAYVRRSEKGVQPPEDTLGGAQAAAAISRSS